MGDFQVPCSFSPRCIPMWVAGLSWTNLPNIPTKISCQFSSSPNSSFYHWTKHVFEMRTLMYIDTSSLKKPTFHGAQRYSHFGTHQTGTPFPTGLLEPMSSWEDVWPNGWNWSCSFGTPVNSPVEVWVNIPILYRVSAPSEVVGNGIFEPSTVWIPVWSWVVQSLLSGDCFCPLKKALDLFHTQLTYL